MRFCLPFARHFCKFKKEESHFVCQNPYFKSISKFFYPAVGDGLILKALRYKTERLSPLLEYSERAYPNIFVLFFYIIIRVPEVKGAFDRLSKSGRTVNEVSYKLFCQDGTTFTLIFIATVPRPCVLHDFTHAIVSSLLLL